MRIPEKCWYCGLRAMHVNDMGTRCASCGATWTPPIRLGSKALDDPSHDYVQGKSWSPGAGALVRDLATGELKKTPPEQ